MDHPRPNLPSPSQNLAKRISFRMQVLLVFLFSLAAVGIVMVFVNAYLISGLKENMRRQAFFLAEDLGKKTSKDIQGLLGKNGQHDLLALHDDPRLHRQLEVTLKSNKTVIAACIVNEKGEVVLADFGQNETAWKLKRAKGGIEAEIAPDAGNFTNISVRLRQIDPSIRTRSVEVPIVKEKDMKGRLRLLISENEIYRDIAQASQEITRRLWSMVLAFVSVLTLAVYLLGKLFRRQMQLLEENERLDRMAYVGTLASGLAHEIRNPLNAMSVNISVAEEEMTAGDNGSVETTQKILGLLRREVGRLNRTVTGFMEFAHPTVDRHGQAELRPLIDEVLDLLRPQIEEARVSVDVDVPEGATLFADFSGLRQVLYNLILNAVQAMNAAYDGSRQKILSIGGRKESAQWLLWVEDTGPGVASGEEQKIFEVFHSTKAAGTGLGLSIAKAIVFSHEGDIRAMRGENGGLRVEITLPDTVQKVRPRR